MADMISMYVDVAYTTLDLTRCGGSVVVVLSGG